MEIKSFKKKKNNKYEILLKDGSSVDLYDDTIIKYNLLGNKKINDKKYQEIIEYNSNLDAYFLALKYLNSKMRTKLEIKKYLEKKEIQRKIIDDTINKLEKNKAINEQLYIKAYVNDQVNLGKIGPHKIVNNLFSLGISKENSYSYINTIDEQIWKEKITKLISKKIKANRSYSSKVLKNKILVSLSNEGYDKDMISSILENINLNSDLNIVLKEYNKQKNKLSKKYDGKALEFQIKMKLKSKGFSDEDIDRIQ